MKSPSAGVDPKTAFVGLKRWTASCAILLILATYRLWFPGGTHGFPQVPLFQSLCGVPSWVDSSLLALLVFGLASQIAVGGRFSSATSLLILGSGVGLIVLDQQRLQPWFYQLMLFEVVYLLDDRSDAGASSRLKLLRYLVISVYLYSALGKFDFEFFHTVGQSFLGAAVATVGLDVGDWSPGMRLVGVAVFPLVELAMAVALFWGVHRSNIMFMKFAGLAACVFHVALMGLLGLALQHSLGVVVWNLQFAVQALLLFALPRQKLISPRPELRELPDARPSVPLARGRLRVLPIIVVGWAIAMPAAERFGFWDHWPSWALYAPHSSRVEVYVASSAAKKLPSELQKLLRVDDDALWVRVPLAKWSLAELGTPIYPQARFELGVARALAGTLDSEFAIRAIILSTANRIDGRRTRDELQGAAEIHMAKRQFWFNTQPRDTGPRSDGSAKNRKFHPLAPNARYFVAERRECGLLI